MKTIYSSFIENEDLDNAREYMIDQEFSEDEISDYDLYQTAQFMKDWDLESLMYEFKTYSNKKPLLTYKIEGSLGLWTGRHTIYPVYATSLYNAIDRCVNDRDITNFKILEDRGRLIVEAYHHDGCNKFTITVKDECKNYYKNINFTKFLREDY